MVSLVRAESWFDWFDISNFGLCIDNVHVCVCPSVNSLTFA